MHWPDSKLNSSTLYVPALFMVSGTCDLLLQFSLALSMSESNESDSSTEPLMTLSQKYQCLVYCGNAFYQQGEYRKAVVGVYVSY